MIPGRLLEGAADLLNRRIADSISASRAVADLEGRGCRLSVEGLSLDVVMRVDEGRVALTGSYGGGEDVHVSGTPFDLLRLIGPDAARRIHDSGARVSGEVHTAEQFAELLQLAMPDFEEELSGWVGDIAAHSLAESARRAGQWAASALSALMDDTAEYLEEERRALPGPHEAEAFYADVDRLRDDVERAAARVDRLVAALGAR